MLRRLAPILFSASLLACSDDPAVGAPLPDGGPDTTTPPAPPAPGAMSLVFEAPAQVVSNLCATVTMSALRDGATLPFPSDEDVAVTTDPLTKTFATEADCKSSFGPTAIPLTAGATKRTFYLRTGAEGAVTVSVTTSFASGAFTFTPSTFLTMGQPDTRTVRQIAEGMAGPENVFVHGGKLLVTESGLARVRIWNTLPTSGLAPSSLTLGKPSASTEVSPASDLTFGPAGLWTDGTRLVVADPGGNRVLVWTTFPTTDDQPPTFALGQPAGPANLTSTTANNGGVSGSSMASPRTVTSDGTKLFVADLDNNRVLVWNTFPTTGGASADFALGQPAGASNLSSNAPNAGGASGSTLDHPYSITLAGSKLFIADTFNHRVLAFADLPSEPRAADFALGHPAGADNLTRTGSNDGGLSGSSLNAPYAVASDGTRLVVGELSNHRVLVWPTLPTTAGQAADFALGQPAGAANLTSNAADNGGITGSSLNLPSGVGVGQDLLFVADYQNQRVLVWSTFPTSGGQSASFALGQPGLTTNQRLSIGARADTLTPSGAIATDGVRVFAADSANDRVLVWSAMPTSPTEPAAFAIGQPAGPGNLTSSGGNNGGLSGTSLHTPTAVALIGGKLYVVDSANSRVLVWNTPPTTPGQPASYALGQPAGPSNLTSGAANDGGVGGGTLARPHSIASDGTRLFVSDASNHRVLVWNALPTGAGQPADFALGQEAGASNLTSSSANAPSLSGASLSSPRGILSSGGKLYVADAENNRVLVWNTTPSSGGQPADFALGQPASGNLTTASANNGGISASSLYSPTGLASDGASLFVADRNNNRVLVWAALPTAGGAPATSVIGQPSLDADLGNAGGAVSRDGLVAPSGIYVEPTRLFVSDDNNSRILIVPR